MPRYRNDRDIPWYKRSSLTPLWTGAMLALAFAVVFLVVFGFDPATRQTASNTTVPSPAVAAPFISATDPGSK